MNKTTKKEIDYFIYLTDNMPLPKMLLNNLKRKGKRNETSKYCK